MGLKDCPQAFERRQATLEQVHRPAQRDNRPDQIHQVNVEGRKGADGNLAVEHVAPAHHHDQHESNRKHQAERGPQEAADPDQAPVLLDEFPVHAVKLGHLRLFLAEGANNANARQVLAHSLRQL